MLVEGVVLPAPGAREEAGDRDHVDEEPPHRAPLDRAVAAPP
jgi:hypothetical protein